MHLSPSFRGLVLSLALALATACFSSAQSPYAVGGGESAIAGALIGDQMHPHAAISASGGFLVWQDNATDPFGMGIKAIALDSSLSRSGSPFRVNKNGAGDQENPRVALLNGGGAVFVWQGGRPGFQHIYARFLSTNNTWLTDDLQVNTFNKNSQIHPDVAVFANGNVVVVWSSFNQAGPASLQDVYAQVFSPAGQKIGNEIPVNQTTFYNQRSPSIAPLASGGFVITWISELQRQAPPQVDPVNGISVTNLTSVANLPSVDVYARIYDSNAAPVIGEALVNTGMDPCSSPVVAGGTNGGFMVAWAQRNMLNRSNSWDIFVRSFSSIGLAGPSRAVNTQLYGDQYHPSISSLGTDFLVLWTSLGQDGYREGVYGQFLQSDGSPTGGEFRANDTVVSSQMHPACASDNSGRFLAVWTSFTGVSHGFDLYAKEFISTNFIPPSSTDIVYAAPPLEAFNDSPLIVGDGPPRIDPPPNPPSDSVSNHVGFIKASYCGLFYDDTNGVSSSSAGSVTAATTAQGSFSAKIVLAGSSYSASGRFDLFGRGSAKISRGAMHSLDLEVQLDLGQTQLTGTLSDGHWTADLVANRSISTSTASSAKSLGPAFAGAYTFDLPGGGMSSLSPVGDGFGSVKVDSAGNVSWAVSLADGTKLTQKSALTESGVSPLYLPLYKGAGSVIGWIQFATNGFDSQIVWLRQAAAPGKYYPLGFTNQVEVSGAIYQKPAAGVRALDWSNGSGMALLSGGGLSTASATPISIDTNNRLVSSGDASLKLSINGSSGLFNGSFLHPDTGKKVTFQGAVFRNRKLARGYFLSPTQSGQISLEAAP